MKSNLLIRQLHLLLILIGGSLFFAQFAKAQDITPNQVYQVTEDILSQLERMHQSNLTVANLDELNLEIPERLPRHVLQEALNVRFKIQILKRVNGMEISEIALPPVKDVAPQDVYKVVSAILEELIPFDKTYGLKTFKKSAPLPQDKTPTDVYINLLKAQAMITQLGIPKTVPNDVYRLAVAVSDELVKISKAVGKNAEVEAPSPSVGKGPQDAYTLAYYALKGLKSLAKKDNFAIPKGVILPKRLKKGITPDHVQQVLLYCLAELSSIAVKVGVKEPMVFPEIVGGQTPSSTFDKLGLVNRQIQALQW